jgi:membrane protein YqaA with SNARE-associated domain
VSHSRWHWWFWPEALVALWAVGEATVQPIMPDAIIVPLALARPESWWRLSLAAMLGSTVGGGASNWLGRRAGTAVPKTIGRLLLVRPAMVAATDRWLTTEGPRGAVRQPLTGVPFKVFARLAGARGLPLRRFLAWAVAARGARFLVAAYGSAWIARRIGPLGPRRLATLSILWWFIFGVGLWRMVAYWEQRQADE